jgi:hypothetical protein
MDNTGFWLPAYHYNLFGDPALRQLGYFVDVEENTVQIPIPLFTVFPNPSQGVVTIGMQSPRMSVLEFKIYDVSGRLIKSVQTDETAAENVSIKIKLPAGIYLIRCTGGDDDYQSKLVILEGNPHSSRQ